MHEEYMLRAIELARKGEGSCHPNPKVGAVIVSGGRIIGEGYHARCGELHAERNAIASLTESAENATMYVTHSKAVIILGESKDIVKLVDSKDEEDTKYFVENGIHHVPKLKLGDLILGKK